MFRFAPLEVFKDPEHYHWVKRVVQCLICEDTRGIAVYRGSNMIGAYVFDSWTYNATQCHQAVLDPMAFRHKLHYRAALYVYDDAKRDLMIGPTPADNKRARRLNEHYGFTLDHTIKDGWKRGTDMLIYTMHKDECPYLDAARVWREQMREAA